MGYNRQHIIMTKKVLVGLLFVLAVFGVSKTSIAQTRTKIVDGVYLVRYGNTAVIEDEIKQMTWNLSVTAEEKTDSQGRSTGEIIYELACGNKYTKALTKFTLNGAIVAGITAVAGPYSAAVAGAATTIASVYYDDVCNYYREKYGHD